MKSGIAAAGTGQPVVVPAEPTGGTRSRRADVALWVALSGAMVVASFVLWRLGRGTTFFYDEWDFVTTRRGWSVDSLLRSHNGHLNVASVAMFKMLFELVGLRHYGVFRALLIVSHLACCALLFLYARRRVQGLVPLIAAGLLLGAGRGWEDLLWPFQTALVVSVGAGLATLLFLDRRTRRGDVAAMAMLAVSLASFSFGVPVAVGVGAELMARSAWRRLWIVTAPAAAYAVWFVAYGGTGQPRSRLSDIPAYLWHALDAAAAALFGTDPGRGGLFALFLGIVTLALVWRRAVDRARVLGLAATLSAFWLLTALTRATALPESAGASRYLYIGTAYLVVLLVEVARGLPIRAIPLGGLLFVALLATRSNVEALRAGAAGLRGVSIMVKAELAGVEIAGPHGDPELRPDNQRMPQVTSGAYLAAVRDLGSPAYGVAALTAAPLVVRNAVDATLLASLPIRLTPVPPGNGACTNLIVGGAEVELRSGAASIVIVAGQAPADVRLRRFGTFAPVVFGRVEEGQAAELMLPADGSDVPWRVEVTAGAQVRQCGGVR